MSSITGSQVQAERNRRGMGRRAFAELVGLSEAKIANIEKGRALKEGEEEALRPHVLVEFQEGNVSQLTPHDELTTHGESFSQVPPEPEPQRDVTQGEFGPVILGEDDDEELEQETVVVGEADTYDDVTPGSGLPTKVPFTVPGYHVSNSELRTFKRCRRQWYLAYYRELRPRQEPLTGPRSIGTRLHLALAAYYSTRREDPRRVLEKTITEDRRKLHRRDDTTDDDVSAFESEAELATIMLDGYLDWVQETGQDEGLEIIGDEQIVEAPYDAIPGVVLIGKLDVRVRREIDGARFFLDHKSVGSLTEPLKTLHLNEQMIHYHLLEFLEFLQAGGGSHDFPNAERSHGGLYNMLRKVKRTQRAKPPFFDRVEVRHNLHELREYYLRVFGEITDLLEARRRLDEGADHRQVAYLNPTSDCSWDCDFLAVCPLFNDGSAAEEMLTAVYERGDPHAHYYPYGEHAHQQERTNDA